MVEHPFLPLTELVLGMDPDSQISSDALKPLIPHRNNPGPSYRYPSSQVLPPGPRLAWKPLPPLPGNTPTDPNLLTVPPSSTRRPTTPRLTRSPAYYDGFSRAPAPMEGLAVEAAVPIPPKPGSPGAQADNAGRAAATAEIMRNDPVDTWSLLAIDKTGKRRRGTLGVDNGSIFFISDADKAPVKIWQSLTVLRVSINEDDHNLVDLEISDSSEDLPLDFKAMPMEQANVIVERLVQSRGESSPPPTFSEAAASTGTPAIESRIPSTPDERLLIPLPSHHDLAPSTSSAGRIVVVAAMCDFEAYGDDGFTVKEGEKLTVVDKEESDEWWKCRNSKGKEGVFPASYLEIEPAGEAEDNVAAEAAAAEAARAEVARKEQEQAAAAAAKAIHFGVESRRKREQEARDAQQRQERQEAEAKEAEAQRRREERGRRSREARRGETESAPGLGRVVALVLYPLEADRDDVLTVKKGEKLIVVDTEKFDGWWTCRNSKGKEGIVPAPYLEARIESASEAEDEAAVEAVRKKAAAAVAKAKRLADESKRKREQEVWEAQERQKREEAGAKEAEARRQREERRRRAKEAGRREGEAQAHADISLSTYRLPQNSTVSDPFSKFTGTSENEDRVFEPNATVQPRLPPDPISELSSSAGSLESTFSKLETMVLIDDIGLSITWISPMPVKVNGHFCDVFEGMHAEAGKVALKRPRIDSTGYDDAVVRRFEREAETWRRLRHLHILRFLGTFRRDGHIYFVSPFINNGTLVEYIAARLGVNRIRLLCETADAIQYLHKEGVVHGDLKANNILIDDHGHSLLCDFGLTKTVESRTSTALRGAGTFRWQSPELWDNAPKSFESDVYAFGMTIVEVLTGQVPFYDLRNDVAVMQAVILRDERPSKIPAESPNGISYDNIWDVASACWPKIPGDRISMFEGFQRIRTDPSLVSRYQ